MDRTGRLKELQDALRYLYGQKIDEQAAYDQLRGDPRFEGWIRLPKVQIIYKQLRSERTKSAKTSSSKPLIEEPPISVVSQIKKCIFPFYKATLQCNHELHPCLKNSRGVSVDARFIFYYYRSKTSHNSCKFLLHDLQSNKERYIKIQKTPNAQFICFRSFNSDFGLSFESDGDFMIVNLIELDWTVEKMRAIHTIHFSLRTPSSLFCDPSDSTRFVHISTVEPVGALAKFYEVGNNGIVLEHSNLIETWPGSSSNSFFDGKFYGFEYRNEFGKLPFPSIHVNSLEPNAQTSVFALKWPSDSFQVVFSNDSIVYSWIRDRFYTVIKFDEDETFGVAWISCEMPEWISLDFHTVEPIVRIQFIVEHGILLVQTADEETELDSSNVHQLKRTFYRIPFKKPELLTNLAWSAFVHSKSKIIGIDPYEEARKYLPFTSEIQCQFDE